MIADYKNAVEPHLADGGKYSFPALRGVASKIDMQIMKIAANLHLLDDGFYYPTIADKHVSSAIRIADRLLQHQRMMMIDKGIIGLKAEYQTILDAFDMAKELTERAIIEKKRKVKPFCDISNPREAIRTCLVEMVKSDLLITFTIEKVVHYRLGQ